MPVENMPRSFGINLEKLDLDYNTPREKGHKLTKHEINYITNDILIPARALKSIFGEGLTKMTKASNALCDYKKIIDIYSFNNYFPKLTKEMDAIIRESYKRWIYLC